MPLKQTLTAVAVVACAWPMVGHVQPTAPVLPGIDGLAPALLSPAGASAGALNSLLSNPVPAVRMTRSEQAQAPDLSNGVPGIDGINFSPAALGLAFRGLDPELIRAVLGDADPRLVAQIYESFAGELPGLGKTDEGLLETLPGIDGLPVDLHR